MISVVEIVSDTTDKCQMGTFRYLGNTIFKQVKDACVWVCVYMCRVPMSVLCWLGYGVLKKFTKENVRENIIFDSFG